MIYQIVDKINTALEEAFSIPSQIHGIAEPILIKDDEEVFIPTIIDKDGECSDVFVDDDFKVGLYHKLNSKNYTLSQNKGYGDDPKVIVVADMSMLVWGFLAAAKAEDVQEFIFAKSPREMRFNSVNFDRKQVFSGEFQNVDFFLPPEVFLFKINYKVQYTAVKSCLEINEIFND